MRDRNTATIKKTTSLVICIGNELVADDAVGFEVYQRLLERKPASTRIEFCGVGGVALIDYLTGEESCLVIVDAMHLGLPPGTIFNGDLTELPISLHSAISAHGIGVRETIAVGMLLFPERMPTTIRLIGIEGRCFDLPRYAMTADVESKLDELAQLVFDFVTQHDTEKMHG